MVVFNYVFNYNFILILMQVKLKVGIKAPDFKLPDQDGRIHRLSDYKGQWVLLYFYPKDNTSGCIKEACTMRDNLSNFKDMKTVILGVSVDSVQSHDKFAKKHKLSFPILSDTEKKVVQLYGVWGNKKFLGKEYMGTYRTSFLIDPKGKISKIYKSVKPDIHASEVIEDLSTQK